MLRVTCMRAVLCLVVALVGCSGQSQKVAKSSGDVGRVYADWQVEQQSLVKELVMSLSAEQIRKANRLLRERPFGANLTGGRGKGLPYSDLTAEQQAKLRRIWEIHEEASAPFAARARAARVERGLAPAPAAGPIETAEIFNVGWLRFPEETKANTLLHFTSQRFPLGTMFVAEVAGRLELTPALLAEGNDFNASGQIKWNYTASPEEEKEMREAEEKAAQSGGSYTTSGAHH